MRRFLGWLSYSNVMATVAVFVALAGGAVAATDALSSGAGVIHGCVSKSTHVLRVLKAGKRCGKGSVALNFNAKGVAGAAGRVGPQGPRVREAQRVSEGRRGRRGPQAREGQRVNEDRRAATVRPAFPERRARTRWRCLSQPRRTGRSRTRAAEYRSQSTPPGCSW